MAATEALTDSAEANTSLAEQRRALPDQPGVYLFRDGRGEVIYVGKAKSVRKRVASHFSKAQVPSSPGHAEMVASVEHIECVVVASEAEEPRLSAPPLTSVLPVYPLVPFSASVPPLTVRFAPLPFTAPA